MLLKNDKSQVSTHGRLPERGYANMFEVVALPQQAQA